MISLTGDDLHIDALITLRCARSRCRLPQPIDSGSSRSRSLVCEKVLARLDGRREDNLSADSERVLGQCPKRRNGPAASPARSVPGLRPSAAVRTGRCPLRGRGRRTALIPDPDVLLRRMLDGVNRHLRGVDRQPSIRCWGRRRRMGGRMPANRSGGRSLTTHLGPEPQSTGASGDPP